MTTAQRVENILKASKDARNSDKDMLIIYMQKSGMNLSQEQVKKFKELPAFETLTRIRRKLQEEGKYPASSEVDTIRFEKYKSVKSNIKGASISQTEIVLNDGRRVMPWGE